MAVAAVESGVCVYYVGCGHSEAHQVWYMVPVTAEVRESCLGVIVSPIRCTMAVSRADYSALSVKLRGVLAVTT